MNRQHKFYVVLIAFLMLSPGIVTCSYGQARDSASQPRQRVYSLQVASSREFIDPDYFEQKFNLSENVHYVESGGWFRYLLGAWKTKAEAISRLAGLTFDAFVISYYENGSQVVVRKEAVVPTAIGTDTVPDREITLRDTIQPEQVELVTPIKNDAELKQLYNLKVREADSAFNLAKDLLLARKLYLEASIMDPEKNYPKDQIVEIDKLLTQNQSQSIFPKITLRIYLIAGCAFTGILIVLLYFRLRAKRKRVEEEHDEEYGEYPRLFSENIFEAPADKTQDIAPDPVFGVSEIHDDLDFRLNSLDMLQRMAAELELIRINIQDPFCFLDHLRQEFTPLEQLLILETVKLEGIGYPDFSRWLNSPNESVVLFCKRMLGKQVIKDFPETGEEEAQQAALKILNRHFGR